MLTRNNLKQLAKLTCYHFTFKGTNLYFAIKAQDNNAN